MRKTDKNNNSDVIVQPSNLSDSEVIISGYKHASNLIIVATILLPKVTFVLENIPDVLDTKLLIEILINLEAEVAFIDGYIKINTVNLINKRIDVELTKQVHGTLYLLPALLCRFGQVELGRCGGCSIGEADFYGNFRPVSHIIEVLQNFGARFEFKGEYISGFLEKLTVPSIVDIQDYSDDPDELVGQYVSGATKTAILMAISIADKELSIKNPYIKADVRELLNFLSSAGVEIHQTKSCLRIKNSYQTQEIFYTLMSDINEIFTYITLAVFNHVNLKLTNITVEQARQAFIQEEKILKNMGINLDWNINSVSISKVSSLNSFDIDIGQAEKHTVYADHQPFFALLLTMGKKPSKITDRVWKKRFQYVPELQKLGYQMQEMDGGILNIIPGKKPHNEPVEFLYGHDVRATALMLIVALNQKFKVRVTGIEHLCRGYVDYIGKLKSIGANIESVVEE